MAAESGTRLVDAKSALATCSELNIFTVPDTQISINSGHWRIVLSRNNLDSRGPWSFELNSGPHYILLCKNYLYLKLRIVRTDGGQIQNIDTTNDLVGPINMIASTFFKTVKLYIGGKLISDSNDLYAYRAIIETELNFNAESRKAGHLKVAMYAQDLPPNHLEDRQNTGWDERRQWFNHSRDVEMMVPIHTDLFHCEKLLPTNTNVVLELVRNDDDFCLKNYEVAPVAPAVLRTYEIRVSELKWFVRHLDLNKSAHFGIENTLIRFPAKYALRRVEMARISVATGADTTPHHTLFHGQIPRRMVFGCVTRAALNGHRTQNPFRFQPFGIKEVTVTAGGVTFNRDPLRTNFEQEQYLRAYLQLLDAMGFGQPENKSCGITPQLYKAGMALFAFDLTPNETDGFHFELARQGSTTLEVLFDPALTVPIEIIVYAEFDSLLRIDRNRECYIPQLL
jgi:hypothetical protein